MTLAELQQYCSDSQERPQIDHPYNEGEFTIATNGNILLRVPKVDGIEGVAGPMTEPLFERAECDEGVPLPVLDESNLAKCEQCEGFGLWTKCFRCNGSTSHECECGHIHDCSECDGRGGQASMDGADCGECLGRGIAIAQELVRFGPRRFKRRLFQLLMQLPNVRLSIGGSPGRPAYFRFDGGDGLIMGMSPSYEPRGGVLELVMESV